MDDDQADVLKSVVCLLTVASVAKAKAKARAKKVRRKRKTVWVRQWLLDRPNYGLYDKLMAQLAEGDVKSFINFMRMEPEMFYKLVEDLTPKIKKKTTRWREPLPPALRLAVTLRYLATGESYQSLGYAFRVAPNTLVSMVPEVCQAIYDHYHDMVFKCPTTEEEWKEVAQAFSNKWHFHHCCGCIDGKHVRIQAPAHSGSLYHNYKGFSSVIMLAVVDANYRFLYVDMGSYGADSNAGIFRETGLYQALEEDKASLPGSEPLPDGDAAVPYFLVGDDAFPLRSWLMKPHSKKELSPEERIFNYRLCRARRIVENAFGILANRFRCFHTCMMQKPHTITKIVLAACTLHNLLTPTRAGEDQVAPDMRDVENPLPGIRVVPFGHNTGTALGKRVREYLTEYYSGVGAVPWQNAMVGLQD